MGTEMYEIKRTLETKENNRLSDVTSQKSNVLQNYNCLDAIQTFFFKEVYQLDGSFL